MSPTTASLGPASTATSGVPISANPKPDTACAAAASATTPNTPSQTQIIPASSQARGRGYAPRCSRSRRSWWTSTAPPALQDVSELLLDAFGEPGWERFDNAVDRAEMGLREAAEHQVAMLRGSPEEMLAFALERAELAPTFAPVRRMGRGRSLPLELASDGFAFYIRPILERADLGRLEVMTNEFVSDDGEASSVTRTATPNASAAAPARC